MSQITGDSNNNIIKFNGPFRIITTDNDEREIQVGENHLYSPCVSGKNFITNLTTFVGESTVCKPKND